MTRHVILNGILVEADRAGISPLREGLRDRQGLFETIRLVDGRPAFFMEHTERLRRGAGQLEMDWSVSDEELGSRCTQLARANAIADGVLNLMVFQDKEGIAELILTRESPYKPESLAQGFKLKSVPDGGRSGGFHRLKILNQSANATARTAARAGGYDEALFHDSDGALLEGSATNIFVVARGLARTPGLHSPILPGIVRAEILRLGSGGGTQEATVTLAQALEADEVFVTNSLVGVMPVSRLDGRDFDLGRNPVTRRVMDAFLLAEAESIKRMDR